MAIVCALMKMTTDDWQDLLARERNYRQAFLHDAFLMLSFNGISGDYVEFGSHGANTFRAAHSESRRFGGTQHLWAFDSFEGFPEPTETQDAHPQWNAGGMSTSEVEFHRLCAEHGMSPNEYTAVAGYFRDSLSSRTQETSPSNIALAYIDCDLYSSTKDVHAFLAPRLKHGQVIAYDDYFCYSATQPSGERAAHQELDQAQPQWRFVPYARFGWAGQAFVVESAT